MQYRCSACRQSASVTDTRPHCPCGGLWDLEYSPPAFHESLIQKNIWGLLRYARFLPVLEQHLQQVTLGEGMTPILQLDDDVLLKMDYFMPTLSYKDRGAAVLIAHAKSISISSVVQDSSGNAGNSIAAYCARANIQCEIFVPDGVSPAKANMIESHGATLRIVSGSREDCAQACRQAARQQGKFYASHVYNPFFYEGTKTYIYEVFEQLGYMPQTIFVPVGNGTLFLGIVKGLEELIAGGNINAMPHIVAIQSEHCAPLQAAFLAGDSEPQRVHTRATLAEGIAISAPLRGKKILEKAYQYGMEFILAPEDRIIPARGLLAQKGIYCEHTSAAIYAAYLAYREKHGHTGACLLPITGAGLKSDH
ncbi:threonine synthase [Eubacteriales bacterium OttesenSCG-928-K08]|nr:threonine synthase [Eubacteriales bacterium OttesenSCG-928-K08]